MYGSVLVVEAIQLNFIVVVQKQEGQDGIYVLKQIVELILKMMVGPALETDL